MDVETRELRLALEWRLTPRASLQLQLPYRYVGGGNLDSFIDTWHDVFGLPEGARPLLSKNQMQVGYSRPGTQLWLDAPVEGLGDATLNLGYELYASDTSALRGVLGVKLPTGDTHVLNSSGATDISAIVAAEHRFADQWHAYAQVAGTWIGEGDLLPAQQRDTVWSGQIGVGWQATRAVELKVQLDGHTRVFDDSQLTFFGDALVLTVGGAYTFRSGWTVDLGVSEDIEVEASPDVVFVIGLSKARRSR